MQDPFVIEEDGLDGAEPGDVRLDLLPQETSTFSGNKDPINFQVNDDDLQLEDEFNIIKTIDFKGHPVYLESLDFRKSWKLRLQVISTFISFLVIGLLEQTIGSILHYLLEEYNVDRVQISYLFLIQFTGYLVASFSSGYIHSKVGFYGFYVASLAFAILTCLVFASRPPLICLKIVSVFSGLSNGGQDCCVNTFIGNLKFSNQIMGIVHSCYGIGCLITPVLVTYMIHQGWTWNQYYLFILAVASVAFVMALFLFQNETKWKYAYSVEQGREESDEFEEVTIVSCLKNRYLQFFALALFIYVGGELAVGTWVYNYLLTIKKIGDSEASYITASYWLSMTMGRIVLAFVSGHYFENVEYKAVVIFSGAVSLGCLGFTALQNSSLKLQVAFLCIIGFFIGPMFGTTVIVSIKTLPKSMSTLGVGMISGLGGTGAAALPWVVGWISEHFGGGSGGGLVYFPLIVFVTFTFTFALWLGFFFFNRRKLSVKLRQSYTPLEQE